MLARADRTGNAVADRHSRWCSSLLRPGMGSAVLPFPHRRAFCLRRRRSAADQHAGRSDVGQVLHVRPGADAHAECRCVGVRERQGPARVDRLPRPGHLHGDGTRDLRDDGNGHRLRPLLHRQARFRPHRRPARSRPDGSLCRAHRRVPQLQGGPHDAVLRNRCVAVRVTGSRARALAPTRSCSKTAWKSACWPTSGRGCR